MVLRASSDVDTSLDEVLFSRKLITTDSTSGLSNLSVDVQRMDERHDPNTISKLSDIRKMLITTLHIKNHRPEFMEYGNSTAVVGSCRGKPGCRVYSSAPA